MRPMEKRYTVNHNLARSSPERRRQKSPRLSWLEPRTLSPGSHDPPFLSSPHKMNLCPTAVLIACSWSFCSPSKQKGSKNIQEQETPTLNTFVSFCGVGLQSLGNRTRIRDCLWVRNDYFIRCLIINVFLLNLLLWEKKKGRSSKICIICIISEPFRSQY